MTRGLASMASAAVAAGTAPWAASGPVLAAVRFQTVVGWPALIRAAASALPIRPRPRTDTGALLLATGGSFGAFRWVRLRSSWGAVGRTRTTI
ncbi:hypothetical protein SALBM135S_03023 [Streptomyces alboniger]